jgi:hypothetical protein
MQCRSKTRGHALCSCLLNYKMAATYKSTEYRNFIFIQIHFWAEIQCEKQRNFGNYLYLNYFVVYTDNSK